MIPGALTSIKLNKSVSMFPLPSIGTPKGLITLPKNLLLTGICNKLPEATTLSHSLINLSLLKITT